MEYPYKHDYIMRLSIGLANGQQTDTTNPSTESPYSQVEWEALPPEKRRKWLEKELDEWKAGLIDASINTD